MDNLHYLRPTVSSIRQRPISAQTLRCREAFLRGALHTVPQPSREALRVRSADGAHIVMVDGCPLAYGGAGEDKRPHMLTTGELRELCIVTPGLCLGQRGMPPSSSPLGVTVDSTHRAPVRTGYVDLVGNTVATTCSGWEFTVERRGLPQAEEKKKLPQKAPPTAPPTCPPPSGIIHPAARPIRSIVPPLFQHVHPEEASRRKENHLRALWPGGFGNKATRQQRTELSESSQGLRFRAGGRRREKK